MKGYKAFDKDLTCLGYQFTTDDAHTFDGKPILCEQGFPLLHRFTRCSQILPQSYYESI